MSDSLYYMTQPELTAQGDNYYVWKKHIKPFMMEIIYTIFLFVPFNTKCGIGEALSANALFWVNWVGWVAGRCTFWYVQFPRLFNKSMHGLCLMCKDRGKLAPMGEQSAQQRWRQPAHAEDIHHTRCQMTSTDCTPTHLTICGWLTSFHRPITIINGFNPKGHRQLTIQPHTPLYPFTNTSQNVTRHLISGPSYWVYFKSATH